MSFGNKGSIDPEDIASMGIVDAALHGKGHPLAFTLSLATLLFLAVFYIWADHAMISDVIRGNGRVIPAEGIRDIQSEKGGTIEKIFVKEGNLVEPNEIVATISNVQDVSVLQDLINRQGELESALIRLQAEHDNSELIFPEDIAKRYPAAVLSQEQIYYANKQLFEGEDKQLLSQIEQRKKEVEIGKNKKESLEQILKVSYEKRDRYKPLVGTSVSKFEFLQLQEQIVADEGELTAVIQSISASESAAVAAEERLNTRKAERQNKVAEDRHIFRRELDEIKQRIATGSDVVGSAELRSPVEGVVKEIKLPVNSVARPAEVIMQIIPTGDTLEIEAKFKPSDRGFLYIGQTGMAKFSNYDFSIYGGLEATVTRISEDTIEDRRGESWYEVRLVTKKKHLIYQGQELHLFPGLTVTVDLLSNKRSVMNHILTPVMSAFESAFSEH